MNRMRHPIYVRTMTTEERTAVEAGLRSSDTFTLRRCQILLASADGQHAALIARSLHCDDQTVRNAIHAFNAHGLECLEPRSTAPHTVPHAIFDEDRLDRLRDLLHQSPRDYDHPKSQWTLDLVATVAYAEGITPRQVSGEAVRQALHRLGVNWKRAKNWIHSPDPEYARKKQRRDDLIARAAKCPEWAVGFVDEVWWSRIAQPVRHVWVKGTEIPRATELHIPKNEQKAMACYGLLLKQEPDTPSQMLLRFVDGRPVSAVTTDFLEWACDQLNEQGLRVWVLVWDNAPWHTSREVRDWIRSHNHQVKTTGQGVRILPCFLPTQSPWLNPIEAKWGHGKRAITELDRPLTPNELEQRVCAYYDCPMLDHLIHPNLREPEKAA